MLSASLCVCICTYILSRFEVHYKCTFNAIKRTSFSQGKVTESNVFIKALYCFDYGRNVAGWFRVTLISPFFVLELICDTLQQYNGCWRFPHRCRTSIRPCLHPWSGWRKRPMPVNVLWCTKDSWNICSNVRSPKGGLRLTSESLFIIFNFASTNMTGKSTSMSVLCSFLCMKN